MLNNSTRARVGEFVLVVREIAQPERREAVTSISNHGGELNKT
nr:MAG TPA: hypothetical protein [Caudoviricetes sp.]